MSYLTQMLGLAVQNFLLRRHRHRRRHRADPRLCPPYGQDHRQRLGRSDPHHAYVLLPISLVIRRVPGQPGRRSRTSTPYKDVTTLEVTRYETSQDWMPRPAAQGRQGRRVTESRKPRTQTLPMGPVASQEAIKMLGTNGGGFFNANSAHPYSKTRRRFPTSSRCCRSS
jgi:K+-transporting ATPase ATPase A chain